MALIGYKEAAHRLGVDVSTLYNWVSIKKIPHRRFTRRCVRFDADELEAWIRVHRVTVEPTP
ncbi:MAG: helix-turn-helix domain-containing protein [Myxococcales bacterium]|nr:helix-turn-helix domain-containing protein [Myxococcales bacterium]